MGNGQSDSKRLREIKREEEKNIRKILAMTRRSQNHQTDLSGEVTAAAVDAAMAVSPDAEQYAMPAAALAAALQALPQSDRPEMEGSWDDVFAESENCSLCREALIASLDERIATLTRVLEAPDDDPAEMAAARAALARSRAYPHLEEWRPYEERTTRETYRSALGGGVLPSEEACVLALYRDLLNGGEPGEAECNTSTGEDTVDKEDLKHELVLQKTHRQLTGSDLNSYELKTAMMWVCERRAPELWTWDGMLESMMAVIDFLLECVGKYSATVPGKYNAGLQCYFSRNIDLWNLRDEEDITYQQAKVFRFRLLLPRAIQLLLAGLLSSSQAPLMRHLLNLPLDAQQMLWCCWKRRVDDPYPMGTGWDNEEEIDPEDLCCLMYPAAVEGRLWSERFLDTFRWESLPARCREPDWFAEHGWDTDSEGEEEDRKDTDGEGEGQGGVAGAMKTGNGDSDATETAEDGGKEVE
ncbi:hypothetical protein FJT64_017995 [Amphibalanus amphitrite]|uniref:Mab-21-like HhH/H2TH-like domain-containing protein n=1 Tax=Amphibalanus amphitrite TaxID=1232801 RepID=A0A6A4WWC0_AMPAM|nr:hypothetical protein FJT64_017995 [Amphibalanus amphitrite]